MVLALAEGPIVLTEGETLLVSCYFAGVPLPNEITWNKTGTPLNTSDPRITIETNTDNITLIITSVLVSDGGVYTCYATNDVGRASANTSVTVEGKKTTFLKLKSLTFYLLCLNQHPQYLPSSTHCFL